MAHGIDESLCVAKVPLFAGLTDDEQWNVARFAHPIRKRAGEAIHLPGDDVSHLLVVHRGRVKISRIDAGGGEQLVRVLEPGDFTGETAFITGAHPDHAATALSEVELCSFSHADLQSLVDEYPAIAVQMLRTVTLRLDDAERFIADLTLTPVATRLARYLSGLPVSRTDGSAMLRLPYAKKDVASLLGMTPETLSRQLAAFADARAISVEGREIRLLDEGVLARIAAPHEPA